MRPRRIAHGGRCPPRPSLYGAAADGPERASSRALARQLAMHQKKRGVTFGVLAPLVHVRLRSPSRPRATRRPPGSAPLSVGLTARRGSNPHEHGLQRSGPPLLAVAAVAAGAVLLIGALAGGGSSPTPVPGRELRPVAASAESLPAEREPMATPTANQGTSAALTGEALAAAAGERPSGPSSSSSPSEPRRAKRAEPRRPRSPAAEPRQRAAPAPAAPSPPAAAAPAAPAAPAPRPRRAPPASTGGPAVEFFP